MIEFDYKADMGRCRTAAGDMTLVGNIDPSGVLALGTPEEGVAECRRAIDVLGKNGRFILSPGCTLPATTPVENVEAMMEALVRSGSTRRANHESARRTCSGPSASSDPKPSR